MIELLKNKNTPIYNLSRELKQKGYIVEVELKGYYFELRKYLKHEGVKMLHEKVFFNKNGYKIYNRTEIEKFNNNQ